MYEASIAKGSNFRDKGKSDGTNSDVLLPLFLRNRNITEITVKAEFTIADIALKPHRTLAQRLYPIGMQMDYTEIFKPCKRGTVLFPPRGSAFGVVGVDDHPLATSARLAQPFLIHLSQINPQFDLSAVVFLPQLGFVVSPYPFGNHEAIAGVKGKCR